MFKEVVYKREREREGYKRENGFGWYSKSISHHYKEMKREREREREREWEGNFGHFG